MNMLSLLFYEVFLVVYVSLVLSSFARPQGKGIDARLQRYLIRHTFSETRLLSTEILGHPPSHTLLANLHENLKFRHQTLASIPSCFSFDQVSERVNDHLLPPDILRHFQIPFNLTGIGDRKGAWGSRRIIQRRKPVDDARPFLAQNPDGVLPEELSRAHQVSLRLDILRGREDVQDFDVRVSNVTDVAEVGSNLVREGTTFLPCDELVEEAVGANFRSSRDREPLGEWAIDERRVDWRVDGQT